MFRKSQAEQISFTGEEKRSNSQAMRAVDGSRAKMVGDYLYDQINEEKFSALYSEKNSRPNIEIRRYVSALVLERMYRLSDENFLEFLRCGALNFQYALHTTDLERQPLSENSLRRFRGKVRAYNEEHHCDLIREEFERISRELAVDMGLLGKDPHESGESVVVRMDSMEIEAHAKVMTRVEILYMSVVIVLRFLLKKGFEEIIPLELSHYCQDGDHNQVLYYRVKEEKKAAEQDRRVETIIREMTLLEDALQQNFTPAFLETIAEYRVFERVLEEQTLIGENGLRVAKDKKDISADSVQNPFDTTVTYRYKRGAHHGSVLNVAEVVDGKGNGIIIQATLKANTESDSAMAEEYLNSLPENGPGQKLVADGGYSSEELKNNAQEKNVELTTTSLTGKLPDDVFGDFELNEEKDEVKSCPCGNIPTSCKYNPNTGNITATMPNNCCASCPNRDKCKAKVNEKKQKSTVMVNGKTVSRARQVRQLSEEDVKLLARCRNGVEGIVSVLRRKYGLDHIPVFGLSSSSLWVFTSLIAYNLVKYKRYLEESKKIASVV